MKKVGEFVRRTMLLTALSTVLVLALPVAAGAQFMDPVLEQYAPSSQQIDKKVKGDKGDKATATTAAARLRVMRRPGREVLLEGSARAPTEERTTAAGTTPAEPEAAREAVEATRAAAPPVAAPMARRAGTPLEQIPAPAIPGSMRVFSPTCLSPGSISSLSRLLPAR